MKKNMSKTDQYVRIVLAIVLGVLSYAGVVTGVTAIVFMILAAVFLLTSFMMFCPLYALVGLSTCKKQ